MGGIENGVVIFVVYSHELSCSRRLTGCIIYTVKIDNIHKDLPINWIPYSILPMKHVSAVQKMTCCTTVHMQYSVVFIVLCLVSTSPKTYQSFPFLTCWVQLRGQDTASSIDFPAWGSASQIEKPRFPLVSPFFTSFFPSLYNGPFPSTSSSPPNT